MAPEYIGSGLGVGCCITLTSWVLCPWARKNMHVGEKATGRNPLLLNQKAAASNPNVVLAAAVLWENQSSAGSWETVAGWAVWLAFT